MKLLETLFLTSPFVVNVDLVEALLRTTGS